MYLGRIVELAPAAEIFAAPRHPYTRALLAAVPRLERDGEIGGGIIEGEPPSPRNLPSGCAFRTRCPYAVDAVRRGGAGALAGRSRARGRLPALARDRSGRAARTRGERGTGMKAAFYTGYGAAREVLEIGELPEPQPGPGEVRVRVRFSASTRPTAIAASASATGRAIR